LTPAICSALLAAADAAAAATLIEKKVWIAQQMLHFVTKVQQMLHIITNFGEPQKCIHKTRI
jgi:hypothetical protein